MQARHGIALFLLSVSLATAHAGSAYPEYRVTVVAPANSAAADINKFGVVVGSYPAGGSSIHAFLNRGKGLVDLGAMRGASSRAEAINDKGQVLGNYLDAFGQPAGGFIYYRGDRRNLGTLPGRFTIYSDINNAGYTTASGVATGGYHAFLRSPDGKLRDIGSLPFRNPTTMAEALNNRNQITGNSGPLLLPDPPVHAYIWTNGVMRDLGNLGGGAPNSGLAINDHGQVTGYAAVPPGRLNRAAFLYTHGRLIDIDGRPPTAERFSLGTGINNHGYVVGESNDLSGFIYRGRRRESLNSLIDPKLGWDIRSPAAINDAGQIAATAYRKGISYAVRLDLIRPHGMALPAPEPDEEAASPVTPMSEADAAAEAKADAEAAAHEVAQPVQQ